MSLFCPLAPVIIHQEAAVSEVAMPVPGDLLLYHQGPRTKDPVSNQEASMAEWSELNEINRNAIHKDISAIQRHKEGNVTFNIRGVRYEVDKMCLKRAPKASKFANLDEEIANYDQVKKEYYFNRDPYIFNSFINFLVNGELHFRTCVCIDELEREMSFWGIGDYLLQHCCWERAQNAKVRERAMVVVEKEWFGMVLDYENKKPNEVPFRDKLWLFLEEPASSTGAQVINVNSCFSYTPTFQKFRVSLNYA